MMAITKIISSLIILTMLSGCFGQTLFTVGPVPIKPGDMLTSPIKHKIIVDKKVAIANKEWYNVYYDETNKQEKTTRRFKS